MRKIVGLVGAVGMLTLGFASPAQADEHEHDGPPPPHGHVLILGVQWDGEEPDGFRKCIDLAGGNHLKKNNHHYTVHTGKAGEALYNAGHLVVPTAPLSPFRDCSDVEALLD